MGLSVTEIYQQALSLAGSRGIVSSPTENSREAELCNRFYPTVRDIVFRSAHWAAGKQAARLALLAERDFDVEWTSAMPMPPWRYAYGLPSGYLHARFLTDYSRFELARFGTSNALLCDKEDAILIFTAQEQNTALWDVMLADAVVYGLAASIIGPLTGSTRKKQELFQQANNQITAARVADANNDMVWHEAMPDWLQARGIGGPSPLNRYIYPVGPLFAGATD